MSSEKIAIDGKFGCSGMTVGEAISRFKQAKDRRKILDILSDESGLTVDLIKAMFVGAGVDYKLFPRARRRPDLPEVKPEDAERLQAERDRPKPKPPGRPPAPKEQDQTIKADAGKPELRLVPWQIVRDIAQVRTYGNRKYGDSESWRRVERERYIDALLRHVIAFAEDPDGLDAESGIEHYKHAACNLAFLCEMMKGEKDG